MKHHETKNTVSVSAWCNTCGRTTQHACSGKRRGHCLEHEAAGLSKKQEQARKKREQEEREPKLF
jgi:hypothetical protein